MIFASGNGGTSFPGQVGYPAKLPFVLAVGATQLNDYRWSYSQYGSTLDLVAPSGNTNFNGDVWTMDQMSSLGWNPTESSNCPPGSNDQDYDCHFGGASAACPLVAGTAALLLAKDSTLSAAAGLVSTGPCHSERSQAGLVVGGQTSVLHNVRI